jgi:RNA polymerase sigma-70 factor (ECF subfamily)
MFKEDNIGPQIRHPARLQVVKASKFRLFSSNGSGSQIFRNLRAGCGHYMSAMNKQAKPRAGRDIESWFLEHADAIYTFVYYRVGRDEELATEVVQETFLSALERIEDYDRERGPMLPWLTYTARNCIRKALRQRGRLQSVGDRWEVIDRKLLAACSELATRPLPDELLEREETAELVQMALSNLPDKYRIALRQHYCLQRPLREIADDLGVTEGAVKSLLHRARLAFKAAFETIAESFERQPRPRRVIP